MRDAKGVTTTLDQRNKYLNTPSLPHKTLHTAFALLCLALMAFGLSGCHQKTVYHHFEHLRLTGWENVDTVRFCIPAVRDGGFFDITLGMRTTREYPFEQLSLVVRQRISPSGRFRCDTISCKMAEHNGDRTGNGISLFSYQFPLAEQQLMTGDSLTVTICHNMRKETIHGIKDIGLLLRRHEAVGSTNEQDYGWRLFAGR